jgi:hypothetical protein
MIYGSDSISKQLRAVRPEKIAVAYIGDKWSHFIEKNQLLTAIVSPNLGSNPSAIVELAKAIGWKNVWLSEELHSKIYIGSNSVMIGSANLSNNAFGYGTQEEACVVLNGEESVCQAKTLFDKYLTRAKNKFPDKKSKLDRIEKLRKEHRKAISHGLIQQNITRLKSFSDYSHERDGIFYFSWYVNGYTEYTDYVPKNVQDDIAAEVHLSPDDLKPDCQWILYWLKTSSGKVDRRSSPSWVYVHELFENGCSDNGYEMLCLQRKSMHVPKKPFDETDPIFIKAFRNVMNYEKFSTLRGISSDKWRLRDKIEETKQLMVMLQGEYQKIKSQQ